MRVQRIRIKNFKVLRDVDLKDVPGFAVFLGGNGTGKSTLIDVFDFLKDCLNDNVRSAILKRGGFGEVVSRGHTDEAIEIELKVKITFSDGRERVVTYDLAFAASEGLGGAMRPVVRREVLKYTRHKQGQPYAFVNFKDGSGEAVPEDDDVKGADVPDTKLKREPQSLTSPDMLAIDSLGQLERFEAASRLRTLIEGWTVSDIHVDQARQVREQGYDEHLSPSGDNLALVAQYLRDTHPGVFQDILEKMAARVPGVAEVLAETTPDGRTILRFRDGAFADPFIGRAVSDGTIKMFAYLVLLYDPEPHPLLCVEEPENQLHPELLPLLAEEFSAYARRRGREGQVFVTTHSPDFINAVPLDALYWFEKRNGFSTVKRAKHDANVSALTAEGDRLGELWRQHVFGGL